MTSSAKFTFYGDLNLFLSRQRKYRTFAHDFDWRASIKDMIESLGPPHPEIELIIVNGQSVDFEYIVQANDQISVYSDYGAVDRPSKVRLIPLYTGKPRFILDTHLGRLASYLRMMGFDTLYRNDYDDDVLAEVSHDEERILLTRDVGVLKRSKVVYGHYVRNTDPRLRLHEISARYALATYIEPFKHCMKCNGLLHLVDKIDILDEIKPDTAEYFDVFHKCQHCSRIYWKGSHYSKMSKLIDELMRE